MRYEFLIASRYLRSRRKSAFISITTFFTAIGVMIGVAALTITIAVMSGFEGNLRSRILSLSPHVQIARYGGMTNCWVSTTRIYARLNRGWACGSARTAARSKSPVRTLIKSCPAGS